MTKAFNSLFSLFLTIPREFYFPFPSFLLLTEAFYYLSLSSPPNSIQAKLYSPTLKPRLQVLSLVSLFSLKLL